MEERSSPISVVCVSTESVSVAGGGVAGEIVLVCSCVPPLEASRRQELTVIEARIATSRNVFLIKVTSGTP